MGEGAGFPRVRAMVNQVSPNTNSGSEGVLTNLLVGFLM
jgi:hypothetical protein